MLRELAVPLGSYFCGLLLQLCCPFAVYDSTTDSRWGIALLSMGFPLTMITLEVTLGEGPFPPPLPTGELIFAVICAHDRPPRMEMGSLD